MTSVFYDKTEKGRLEIGTRQFQLASKLRPLLLIIDGKRTTVDILKSTAGLGLNEQHLNELYLQGFIAERREDVAHNTDTSTQDSAVTEITQSRSVKSEAIPIDSAQTPPTDDFEQRIALKTFFNESVKSVLGLRGFGFQLKVERAETVQDFRDLREPFLEAIYKAKGEDMVQSVRMQLDQILKHGKT